MKTALVAGGTGLIGNLVVQLLLDDASYATVKVVTRKPLTIQHTKLVNIVCNFDALSDVSDQLSADVVFCCLGTTMKQAGTKEAFEKVDYHYPLILARLCKPSASHFLLITALGANEKSSIYYNQVKGRIEKAIQEIGFPSLHIFRPSLLLGDREQVRPGEQSAIKAYKIFGFLIPAKYKGIEGIRVARAMLAFGADPKRGSFVHESLELQQF